MNKTDHNNTGIATLLFSISAWVLLSLPIECRETGPTVLRPIVRTNYGKFNIRFFGPKVWNDIDESLKNLSYRGFKRELKAQYIISYNSDN